MPPKAKKAKIEDILRRMSNAFLGKAWPCPFDLGPIDPKEEEYILNKLKKNAD